MRGGWLAVLFVVSAVSVAIAAPPAKVGKGKTAAANVTPDKVELFAAVKAGQVNVRFVPFSEKLASIALQNATSQPLMIVMPAVLAGAPLPTLNGDALPQSLGVTLPVVTAAQAAAPKAMAARGKAGPAAAAQAAGTQAGAAQPDQANADPVREVVVLPGRVTEMQAVCVCLDFGKPTPEPSMPFTLAPLDQVTKRPEIKPLLTAMARGQLPQPIAQLAAWHFNNGMSWQAMSDEGFPDAHIHTAMQAARVLQDMVAKAKEPAPISPGEAVAK